MRYTRITEYAFYSSSVSDPSHILKTATVRGGGGEGGYGGKLIIYAFRSRHLTPGSHSKERVIRLQSWFAGTLSGFVRDDSNKRDFMRLDRELT